jgi:arylsulfatase A-like enzyme
LGYNGLGFNGYNDEVLTPTIDMLAKGGVILDNH